jgi:hypothetical protein
MTDNQRRKMMALFRDKGIEDRSERLAYSAAVVHRSLSSATDLTFDEASAVIDQLESEGADYPWDRYQP